MIRRLLIALLPIAAAFAAMAQNPTPLPGPMMDIRNGRLINALNLNQQLLYNWAPGQTFPGVSSGPALFTANPPLNYSGGVLSIGNVSATASGILTSADYNAFSNKIDTINVANGITISSSGTSRTLGLGQITPVSVNGIVIAPPPSTTLLSLNGDLTIEHTTAINGGGIFNLAGHTVTAPSDGTLVYQSRTLTAGAGLTGGGDLSNDRTFNVVAGDGIIVNPDSVALKTPGTLSASTDNSSAGNHTHEITTTTTGAAGTILSLDGSSAATVSALIAKNIAFDLVNEASQVNFARSASTLNVGYDGAGAITLMNPVVQLKGNLFQPVLSYNTNLGSLTRKFLELHAAELWVETLVAQNTQATIGGRVLVGPTDQLIAPLTTSATTIDVKYNNLANGDRVRLEASAKTEFMAVTSTATSIPGGFRYNVTRNLDGTGANAWDAGDAVFDTGGVGGGFIDLYSVQSTKGSSQTGPSIVGFVRNSTTFNDYTERWAIGHMNGLYGMSSGIYGAGFGRYGVSGYSWVTINDSTDTGIGGVRLGSNNTVRIQLRPDGSGFLANTLISWDTAGNLTVSGNATIAGWTVNASYFAKDTGTNATSAGMAPLDYPFFAGSTYANRATAPFRVTNAGALTATGATITGTITATAGLVGGWTINSNSLTSGSGTNTVGLDSGGTNPAIYAGSATPASAPFRVTQAGAVTATSGTIGGWTLSSTRLSSSNVLIDQAGQYISLGVTPPTSYGSNIGIFIEGANSGRLSLYKDASNYLQWDNSKLLIKAANFTLDASGNITANGGTVGGWTINSAYLAKDTGTNSTSAGMAPTDYPFFAGSTYANRATAPFRITPAGALVATNATITGSITSTSGTIGGWTLGSTSLTSGSGANTVGLDSGGTNPALYAGSATAGSAPFRVTQAGALTATNATITGSITASSGSITGPLTISGASGSIAIGTTPPTSATAGTGLWLDRTGLYSLSSNVQQATLTSAGVTAGTGAVKLDSNGISLLSSFSQSTLNWYDVAAGSIVSSLGEAYLSTVFSIGTYTVKAKAADTGAHTDLVLQARNDGNIDTFLKVIQLGSAFATNAGKGYVTVTGSSTNLLGLTIGASTVPAHMLDVYGTGWFQNSLFVGNSTSATAASEVLHVTKTTSIDRNNVIALFGANANSGNYLTIFGGTANGATMHISTQYYTSDGNIAIGPYSSPDALLVTTSGGVNIGGTSDPGAARLQITNAAGVDDAIPSLGSAGGKLRLLQNAGVYGLLLGTNNSGSSWVQAQRVDGTATAYALLLQPNGGGVNVGGSTDPGSGVFQVTGQIRLNKQNQNALVFENNAGSQTFAILRSFSSTDLNDIQFYDVTNSVIRMTIGATGGVNIGSSNTDPGAANLSMGNGGTGTNIALLTMNGGSGLGGGSQINFNTNGVTGVAVGSERTIVGGSGSSSKATLYASSSAYRLYGIGAGTATFDASGNLTSTSDERKKDIDGSYTRGLDDLEGIQPKIGKWKSDTGMDRTQSYVWPVTAQNALETIPEAVSINANGDYTVDQNVLIATLVNSVKELRKQVAELRGDQPKDRKKDDRRKARETELVALKKVRDIELSEIRKRQDESAKKQIADESKIHGGLAPSSTPVAAANASSAAAVKATPSKAKK